MGYTFSSIEPQSSLQSVIKNFFIIEFNDDTTQLDYLLPDGLPSFFYIQSSDSVQTYFREAKREVIVRSGVYVGYSNTAVELTHKKIKVVGASMYPMFLSVLFGKSPFEFINRFSPLNGMDRFESNVQSLLATSVDPYPNIISLFEKFISERLSHHEFRDDLFKIYENLTGPEGYKNNVKDIAGWLGCSSRYLNSRFQRIFGMSPKKFISLVRFNHALKEIYSMGDDKNLSYIAHETGYHDQSHFIRDFKKICGKTPRELLRNVDSLATKFRLE